ncbi:MAG: hypothetical protein ABI778_10315, partial [Ignavibacteriota bacterium]
MNSPTTFFGVLLGVEVTAFSIIVAVSLVYFQIIYGQFSYQHTRVLLLRFSLVLSLVTGFLSVLFTAGLFLISAYPQLSTRSACIDRVLQWDYWPTSLLICFLFSLLCFGFYVTKNFFILTPIGLAKIYAQGLRGSKIQYYLIRKHGLMEPDAWIFASGPLHLMDFPKLRGEEVDPMEEAQKAQERVEYEQKLKVNEKKYKEIILKASKSPDAIQPIRSITLKVIQNLDEFALLEILNEIEAIAESGLEYFTLLKSDHSQWSPTYQLASKFLDEISELYAV